MFEFVFQLSLVREGLSPFLFVVTHSVLVSDISGHLQHHVWFVLSLLLLGFSRLIPFSSDVFLLFWFEFIVRITLSNFTNIIFVDIAFTWSLGFSLSLLITHELFHFLTILE